MGFSYYSQLIDNEPDRKENASKKTWKGLSFRLSDKIILILLWNPKPGTTAFAFAIGIQWHSGGEPGRGCCQLLVQMKWYIIVEESSHLYCLSVGVIIPKLSMAGLSSVCIFYKQIALPCHTSFDK